MFNAAYGIININFTPLYECRLERNYQVGSAIDKY